MRKYSILSTTAGLALAVAMAPGAWAQTTGNGLAEVGPISPDHGYPMYYRDNGTQYQGEPLRLAPCLSAASVDVAGAPNPLCLTETLLLTATTFDPNGAPPIQLFPNGQPFPGNFAPDGNPANTTFQDEFFYWHGDGALATTPDGDGDPGRAILVLALEGAFLNEVVQSPDQIVFSRVRYRIDNLQDGEEYTITTPFGIVTETADGVGRRNINVTDDQGGFIVGGFDIVLGSNNIGPYLVPTVEAPITATDPFTGETNTFIADPGTPQTVTGSVVQVAADFGTAGTPGLANFWRIEGPGVATGLNPADFEPGQQLCDPALGPDPVATDDCIETNLIGVMGMLADQFGVQPLRTSYTRNAAGNGRIDVFASTVSGQLISAEMSGRTIDLIEEQVGGEGTGRYFGRFTFNGNFPLADEMTLTNETDDPDTTVTSKVISAVQIQQATYNTSGLDAVGGLGTLTLRVNGSDNTSDPNELPMIEVRNSAGELLTCDGSTTIPDNVTVSCTIFPTDKVTATSVRNPASALGAGGGGSAEQSTIITGPNVSQ